MKPQTPTAPPTGRHAAEHECLVRELERRIEILENLEDSSFGNFTTLDWVFCVIAFIILPHIFLWMFV